VAPRASLSQKRTCEAWQAQNKARNIAGLPSPLSCVGVHAQLQPSVQQLRHEQ